MCGRYDNLVQAVETSTGAVRSQIIILGTIRHAVLVDHLGVPEGEARRFDRGLAKENPGKVGRGFLGSAA